MLALNGIVGAGIFALPGALAADYGAAAPALVVLFALPVFLIALPLGEVAGFYDRTGGPVAYAREAFGRFAAFQTGWAYLIARATAFAANATVFAAYVGALIPDLSGSLARAALIVGLTSGLAAINVAGVKRAVGALNIISILKIAPLLALALAAIWRSGAGAPPIVLPSFSDAETAALLVLYAYVGFENVLVVGGETKNARREIPRAMIATLLATMALYGLIVFAYAAAMGGEAASAAPLAALGEKTFGPAGAIIVTLAAIFSVAGNLLGSLAGSPRVLYALAREGDLPALFAGVDARRGTPVAAILSFAALALALALTGAFAALAVVSTLSRFCIYAVSMAALPVIRARRGAAPRTGMMRALSPLILVAGLSFCAFVIAQSTAQSWRAFGGLLAVGTGLYGAARVLRRAPP